jgi:hypothetical protein
LKTAKHDQNICDAGQDIAIIPDCQLNLQAVLHVYGGGIHQIEAARPWPWPVRPQHFALLAGGMQAGQISLLIGLLDAQLRIGLRCGSSESPDFECARCAKRVTHHAAADTAAVAVAWQVNNPAASGGGHLQGDFLALAEHDVMVDRRVVHMQLALVGGNAVAADKGATAGFLVFLAPADQVFPDVTVGGGRNWRLAGGGGGWRWPAGLTRPCSGIA